MEPNVYLLQIKMSLLFFLEIDIPLYITYIYRCRNSRYLYSTIKKMKQPTNQKQAFNDTSSFLGCAPSSHVYIQTYMFIDYKSQSFMAAVGGHV